MDTLIALFNSILPISSEESQLIKQHLLIEVIKKRTRYCEEGMVCKKLGFVEEGVLKVVRTNGKEEEYIPYFVDEGHFAVALESFTSQTPSEEYIEALTDCKIVTINYATLHLLEREVKNLSKIIAKLKETALMQKDKLKSEMLVDDAETRYHKLIERKPTIIQRVSQNNIAQFLGITPYTLSRIRGKQ